MICAGETEKDISSSLVVRSRVLLEKIFFIGLGAEYPREDFLRDRENRSGREPVFGRWRWQSWRPRSTVLQFDTFMPKVHLSETYVSYYFTLRRPLKNAVLLALLPLPCHVAC